MSDLDLIPDQQHTITITWNDDGWATTRLNCHAPHQSACHARFDCDCDHWPDLTINNDGQPSHSANWDENPGSHHGTFDRTHCNLRDWFDTSEELMRGSVTFPVRAEWDGEGYLFHVDQQDGQP